jgi:hypothetical protein
VNTSSIAEKSVPISAAAASIEGFAIRFNDMRFEIQRQFKNKDDDGFYGLSPIGSSRRRDLIKQSSVLFDDIPTSIEKIHRYTVDWPA